MRRAALAAIVAIAALPAAAQEGGPIRTGEHGAFTRVVMSVQPTTEWSLETGGGEAVIFFPGRRLEFGLRDAFARIPRTRITRIETDVTAGGTRVAVSLACDCRISASFVDGRYLALDVSDRDAPLNPAEIAATATASPLAPTKDPAAEAAGAADAVAAAEATLIEQIARAADQGVVVMSPPPQETAAPEAATEESAPPAAPAEPQEAPALRAPEAETRSEAEVEAEAAPLAVTAAEPKATLAAPETLAELALVD